MAERDTARLTAAEIVAGYGDMQILHGVSAEVGAGEVVAVIGPNGCGKSTLMKVLVGLLPLWFGNVLLDGKDISAARPRQRLLDGISYVPQVEGVFANMTVEENLRLGARLFPEGEQDRREEVLALLPALRTRLTDLAGRLSGGQQQMVAIGRALMAGPQVLILDEPSGGLAPNVVDEVFARIRGIADQGTAVLLVEQNVRKALENADRAYVMADGRNRLSGPAADILASEEVQAVYMGQH